jgi:glucosamine--fructose-6-phosphate aminotransferase (isomerizing)
MLALALVAEAVGPALWDSADLDGIPEAIAAVLADPSAEEVALHMSRSDQVITTGRGLLLASALETALKIRETSGIFAEGYSGADLRHGPIAAVRSGVPVLCFRGDNDDSDELVRQLRARGAWVATVGTSGADDLRLPGHVPAALLPIVAAVRGQQVAAAVARLRGVDADQPGGLTKVTLTH